MTLKQRLDQLRTGLAALQDVQRQGRNPLPFVKRLPALEAELEKLKLAQVDAQALRAGDQAPLFTGHDPWGEAVDLSARLAQGPVLLVFYRGNWCPFCNLYLRSLQTRVSAWQLSYGLQMIAVSPEAPDESLKTLEQHRLGFTLISDTGLAIARAFGLAFRLPETMHRLYQELQLDIPNHNRSPEPELPVPATYLIDRSGLILWAHVESDYRQRPSVQDLEFRLKQLFD